MLPRLIRFYRQRTASIAVLALLLAQAIGLAHGIAHPLSRSGLPPATATAALVADAGNWADQLHDAGSAQCRVLDQLSHADALIAAPSLPLLPLPVLAPVAPPRMVLCARIAPAYLARGPPLFLA